MVKPHTRICEGEAELLELLDHYRAMKTFKQKISGPDLERNRGTRRVLGVTNLANRRLPLRSERSVDFGEWCMQNVLSATLATLLLASTGSWAETASPRRTMPHQEECTTPLPAGFWADSAAKPFQRGEAWAWNERICLGHVADMRYAPGGGGSGEACQLAKIEKKGEIVPVYRELRPEFLELILSHEPWASAARHPQAVFRCVLVRGDIDLDDHEIAPTFAFHQGMIDGEVSLVGTKLKPKISDSDLEGRKKSS